MDLPSRRPPAQLPIAALATLPGSGLGGAVYLGHHVDLPDPLLAVVYGLAIVGAAFILSWAAEAAQVDISAGLALAVLALLAVLPEYAVDFVFSYDAGQLYAERGSCPPDRDSPCSLALANMTGANRVLVGVGWPLVVLVGSVAVARSRRRGGSSSTSTGTGEVRMEPPLSADIVYLAIATAYSLTLPLRETLTLWDAAVLVAIFAAYALRLASAPAQEPHLLGVSEWVGRSSTGARRAVVGAMFAFAAVVILLTAEHFAESLVQSGQDLGVDEFLLVQWVAPLASESPELIVACLFAWRLAASSSLGTLLSSKVNQWTLLVGTIPVVFALSATTTDGLPLSTTQRYELLLTAAQSLFAVTLLANRSLTARGAGMLFSLFMVQFVVSITASEAMNRQVILWLSGVYGVLSVLEALRRRHQLVRILRDGLVTPFDDLEATAEVEAGRR